MINWDELKHIHVIRRLQQVLGRWFQSEIFFVDEKGQVQNQPSLENQAEFKNPLVRVLFSSQQGRDLLNRALASCFERVSQEEASELVEDGPLGFEKMYVSPIVIEGDYLGCVVAYSYLENEPDANAVEKAKSLASELDVSVNELDHAIRSLTSLNEEDQRYFFELLGLVSQEVVTFHTEITKREERINALNNQLGERYRYDSMIGKSKPMQELYSLLDKIRNSEATVLIQGENGTGKELIAKAIHYNSPRKDEPFVTVNCSAFNENLLDSELFGHVKGAFTGAVRDKRGLFESADKGTLFLDEIGDMSLSMQVKLLRVLQEGKITPVGGTEEKTVDVRVLAATNQDLKDMVEQGQFREDLYYRINVINVQVPRLRDRKEDIPLLVDHFLLKGCQEKGLPTKYIAKRAFEKIYDYPWPGNIRELENEIERLIVLSGNEEKITADLLSSRIREYGQQSTVQGVRVSGKLKDALEELEKTMIKEGLRRTRWNKSRLAKELGISRAGLIMKVEKYGLDKRRAKSSNGKQNTNAA